LGEAWFGYLHAVLDIDRRQIGVRARHERGSDGGAPVGVALTFVVEQARGAVELLFDQAGDRLVDHLGRSSRIERTDRDAGWCNIRKLRDGQVGNGEHTCQDDEQGNHPREDWTTDEKLRHEDYLTRRIPGCTARA